MKVSAPKFMSSSAPAADVPPADAPAPETPGDPAAPPPPAEPPKQATWPEWFVGVDNALIVLALLFAFLMGSFAARNADVFRHLAAGQRLLNGAYSLGADPFSYTGADRPWVNQNWLFDLSLYAAYSADKTGAVAVVLKAVVFAAAFGVLLWFRRPGHAGWPWAVAIAAGALGSGAAANLRPVVFGMLFGSLLLVLIFRGDWGRRRGRTLALVGGLCWLWGGFDSFAILAPALLLLVAVATAALRAFDSPAAAPTEPVPDAPTEPVADARLRLFDAPPPAGPLFLAAAVGLLGVLLNPTFVIGVTKDPAAAAAQLIPFELAFGSTATLAEDPELRGQSFSLLSNDYWNSKGFGRNAGSAGVFLLVAVGAVALALGVGHPPPGLIALWFASLLACFVHYRFIPLFAVVAVPLVSGLLNSLSGRFALGTVDDPKTRGLLTASRLGRIVTVPLVLVLVAATVPGWLHPQISDQSLARRLEWRIDTDEAFVRGVEQLQEWRTSGKLPADARGLLTHPEFGDYAAWFAPAEPTFIDSRYRFHAAELSDLVRLRKAVLYPPMNPDAPPPESAAPVADSYKAGYVALGQPFQLTRTQSVLTAIIDLSAQRADLSAVWHLDGRTAVIGRANTPEVLAVRQTLSLDPVRQAFAPQSGLPDGPASMPLNPDAGWLATVLDRPPPPAAFRDDGIALLSLAGWTKSIEDQLARMALGAAVGPMGSLGSFPRTGATDAELAFPLLIHRTARLAVHQTPDDPSAYNLLADAYQGRNLLPEFEPQDSARQRLTAAARAAARLTPTERASERQLTAAVHQWLTLFAVQLELDQLDAARESVKKARQALDALPLGGGHEQPGSDVWRQTLFALQNLTPVYRRVTGQELSLGKDEFEFEEQAKKSGRNEPPPTAALMKKLDASVTLMVSKLNEAWDMGTRGAKPGQRALVARRFGLPKAALDGVVAAQDLSAADSGVNPIQLRVELVGLELELGRLEEAAVHLATLEEQLGDGAAGAKTAVAVLRLTKLRRQGNYKEALGLLDDLRGGQFPKLTEQEKQQASQPGVLFLGVSAAVGAPAGAAECLPQFRPPADARPEDLPALSAEFAKTQLDRHPVLAVGNRAREVLLSEAQYYYQRGVLALLDGDMPAARESFAQAVRPQGVPLERVVEVVELVFARGGRQFNFQQVMPSYPFVYPYLRLIDKYRSSPPIP